MLLRDDLRDPEREREGGSVLIWAAAVLLLLILLAGLGIDTAFGLYVAHQLQNAADASALAGAAVVRQDPVLARSRAVAIGEANRAANAPVELAANDANAADGDIVIGHYERRDRVFAAQSTDVNAVKVSTRRTESSLGGPLGLNFGPVFGVDTVEVERAAVAMVAGGIGPAVIALNPTASCSFDLRGTAGGVVVMDGVIMVNSSAREAACHSGRPSLTVSEIHVYGGADMRFEEQVNFTGDLYTGRDPISDPLAELPEPTWSPPSDLGAVLVNGGATRAIGPGFYSGGITVRNGALHCAPGVYILDGAGLDVDGGDLLAEGCLFYITGRGYVNVRGNGRIELSPPDPAAYGYPASPDIAPYAEARVSIFQARDNSNSSRILGTSDFVAEGTFYFPAAELEIGGDSQSFANGLIADTILAHGNGDLVIHFEDQFPPVPRVVFLVE
jgi:Flp pilus assembly protein TadG